MGYVMLLGGARSGKSDRAMRLAVESGLPVTFIATATPLDAEMTERIARHRAQRPRDWTTLEQPLDLFGAIEGVSRDQFLVVDCLTLWVSNLLSAGRGAADVLALAERTASLLAGRDGVLVSNEVGLGIVPASEVTRTFRDVLGAVNTAFARCASRSLFMVAGRALELT